VPPLQLANAFHNLHIPYVHTSMLMVCGGEGDIPGS